MEISLKRRFSVTLLHLRPYPLGYFTVFVNAKGNSNEKRKILVLQKGEDLILVLIKFLIGIIYKYLAKTRLDKVLMCL